MNDRFLRACRRQPVDATPVWFMRQAGRYMAEYRALRARYSMLELCHTPDLATEVTLQPIRRFPLDAAIIFSDLLLPLAAAGPALRLRQGRGAAGRAAAPVARPTSTALSALRAAGGARGHVLEAIRMVKAELGGLVPLIGFAGAPFTLASYAIEGGHSNHYAHTKALMYGNPAAWHRLCALLAETVGRVPRGAGRGGRRRRAAVRLVGGRAEPGRLPRVRPARTRRHIFERADGDRRADDSLRHRHGHAAAADAPRRAATSSGADWRIPLDEAWDAASATTAPSRATSTRRCCSGPRDRMLAGADDVLRRAGGRPGHIFNLGHGILPGTPVEQVEALADHVHGVTRRAACERRAAAPCDCQPVGFAAVSSFGRRCPLQFC